MVKDFCLTTAFEVARIVKPKLVVNGRMYSGYFKTILFLEIPGTSMFQAIRGEDAI